MSGRDRRRGRRVGVRAGSVLAVVCAVVAFGASAALAGRGHAFHQTFAAAGSGPGQLSEPDGVAVNEATGDVYVVDDGNDRVEVFSSTGAFEGQFDGSGTYEVKGKVESGPAAPAGKLSYKAGAPLGLIAVDNTCFRRKLSESTKPTCKEFDPSNGDVYVQDFEHKVVDKFSSSGAFVGEVLVPPAGPFLEETGVAVGAEGDVWVAAEQTERSGWARFTNAVANVFSEFVTDKDPSGAILEPGLALDSSGDIHSATGFKPPIKKVIAKFNPKGELLVRDLVEETSTGVATEYPSNSVYVDNVTHVTRLDAKEPPGVVEVLGEEEGAKHLQGGSGIAVNSATGQIYVADKSANRVAEFILEPPGHPTVESESLSQVTASSATFGAEVNPRGASTTYRFEYGRCASIQSCAESPYEESTPIPEGPVGSDFEVYEVSAHPQDLSPGSAYHFRTVALNEHGEGLGEEKTFTTQPAGILQSLDGRGYELVSPAQKHGTRIFPIFEATPIQAAPEGGAFTFLTESPTEAEPAGYSNLVQVLASRSASGWSSRDLTLPHEAATGQPIGTGNEYRFSSEDLSKGVVQPFGSFVPLSPKASEQTAYLRSNYINGDPNQPCTSECFTPLVTAGNAFEEVAFGEEGLCSSKGHIICGPIAVGATPDLSQVILTSQFGLTEEAEGKGGLYEWSAASGQLHMISVLPSGKAAEPAFLQSLGYRNQTTRNAISPDGERVVWSTNEGHLYLRKLAERETVELDEGLSGIPQYQTANTQASRIFFSEKGELYLYDSESGERRQLTSGAGIEEKAVIVGASEDGSYLYFVGNGQLAGTEGAVKGNCQGEVSSASSRCNLYELHEASGEWQASLVAVLSGEDFPDFATTLAELSARVSPDGQRLAFMSQLPLTGYDNRDANSGKRDEEVFVFDAGTNTLVCASCNPTGARPEGVEYGKLEGGSVAGVFVWHPSTWLAANVPGWTPYRLATAAYQSRYLDNSGRLFFNSSDALSPQDVNGTEDVYEYEPAGLGGCSSESPSFSPRSAGCVGLISSGTSREESGFLDASESGNDVFFLTSSKLVPQDFDTALDVYDAHICSAASPCIKASEEPPPPCASEASCKASPTPQPEIFGAPASATFSGAGNLAPPAPAAKATPKSLTKAQKLARALKACRKDRNKRKRAACERRTRKRYGKR